MNPCFANIPPCFADMPPCFGHMPPCFAVMPLCFADMRLCFANMPPCFADIPPCFADLPLCFTDMRPCFANIRPNCRRTHRASQCEEPVGFFVGMVSTPMWQSSFEGRFQLLRCFHSQLMGLPPHKTNCCKNCWMEKN